MKFTVLILGLLISTGVFACSCEERFETPYPYEIAEKIVENKLNLLVADSEIIEFHPTAIDRLSVAIEGRDSSCVGEILGKPSHMCVEKFRGKFKVTVKDSDCYVVVKVNRKKKSYSAKIVKNTCN